MSGSPYLKRANAVRRGQNGDGEENGAGADGEEARGRNRAWRTALRRHVRGPRIRAHRLRKRLRHSASTPSSYEVTATHGPGRKGIVAMSITKRSGGWWASVAPGRREPTRIIARSQHGGQLIRCPVDACRVAGRSTQGVICVSQPPRRHAWVGGSGQSDGEGRKRQGGE